MAASRARERLGTTELTQRIHDVQQRREVAQLVYRSHAQWPLPPSLGSSANRKSSRSPSRGLRISVLDSSFNPPTLAHLALARSAYPKSEEVSNIDYDAHLLLLSVRNADKAAPKAGEASYAQRLEMMTLLAQELEEVTPSGNVAVAIIDEPTFVRKSSVLRQLLQDMTANLNLARTEEGGSFENQAATPSKQEDEMSEQIKLTFIMGFDTLERFLAPRYYGDSLTGMHEALRKFFAPPPTGDGSEVVCAWRGEHKPDKVDTQEQPLQMETPILENQKRMRETLSLAQPFIASGSLSFTLLTDHEMALSSSEVRAKRSEGGTGWTTMVPGHIKDYVEQTNLYVPE